MGSAGRSSWARKLTDSPQALLLYALLFLMSGVVASLNDILNPFLKQLFDLNYREAALVHFCFYVSPVLLAMPAAVLTERIGYRWAAALALGVVALGGALMGPAAAVSSFGFFLVTVLVISSGNALFGVGANPYISGLGPDGTASSRLNLTHGAYAVGTTLGPMLGSWFVREDTLQEATTIQIPYFLIGGGFLLMSLLLLRYRLPEPREVETPVGAVSGRWWGHRPLLWGFVTLFFYVGAEVATSSLIVKYLEQPAVAGLSTRQAGFFVSVYWGGLMLGRFVGVWSMQRFRSQQVLVFHALMGLVSVVPVIAGRGPLAMWGLLSLGLWHSIMFPAIFGLALRGLGRHTRRASGFLIMAVVGGAILPVVQGSIADLAGLPVSFYLTGLCYLVVLSFAGWGHRSPA